ncbi:MAG: ATP-dependent RNA helicase HrpA, partial [Desulfobulbales bacterium]|nr:ATP-dependent RNA helicase HrpA [Desulfobulbales bacterium]
ATKIKFMTDGILLAETRSDRNLQAYDTIIIDEAHERSLNIDFLLGYTKQLLKKRKNLKIIITSATIDTEKFAAHFSDAPIIKVSGRTYPVEVHYRSAEHDSDDNTGNSYIDLAVQEVLRLRRKKENGDILIFMPTERDIIETIELLNHELQPPASQKGKKQQQPNTIILPLFGRLRPIDQRRVFRQTGARKIVVATNIAETSVTVPGIRYVIDTGLARVSTYNVRARTTSMPVSPISQASCDQRKGRCGRVGPGICIRLYNQEDFLKRPEFTLPEIKRSNLAEVILRMLDLRLGDPASFPFIDPPAARAIRDGYDLLHELGGLDATGKELQLSARGKIMAKLPLDPRISRIIIEARQNNCLQEIVIIASALAIQDPRIRPAEAESAADQAHAKFKVHPSDFLSFLKIWEEFNSVPFTGKGQNKKKSRSTVRKFCRSHFLSYQRLREWQDIHEQISTTLREEKGFTTNRVPASYDKIHFAILSGFLRNIGFRKGKNIYLGPQAKELMLFPGSVLFNKGGQWIMAAEFVETARLYARTAANINVEWLEPLAGDLCRSTFSDPRWEKKSGRVIANEKVVLFGLVIVASRKINYAMINEATRNEARQIFIHNALIDGELPGRYPFLEHNQLLVARFEKIENRLRQRNVLADEYVMYKFYDTLLDPSVHDRASLNRFLKKQKNDRFLFMSEKDILIQAPESEQLSDFPEQLSVAEGVSLKLSYSFDPGGEEDGVTVHIPLDLLDHVSADIFEWLVPGLLPEKVVFLIKGLPKNVRKKLIPIQQTSSELGRELKMFQGSLYTRLAELIYKHFRIKISRNQWPVAQLPPFLKIRYHLHDSAGKTLLTTRNFADLKVDKTPEQKSKSLDELRRKWEKTDIVTWDFHDIPEKIPLKDSRNKLLGFVYPSLQLQEEGSISIRLYSDFVASRRASHEGLLALYRKQLPQHFKLLKKECILPASLWAFYEGLAPRQRLNEDLYAFVLEAIFACKSRAWPPEKDFFKLVADIKKQGIFKRASQLKDLVLQLLKERRATLDQILKTENMVRAKSRTVMDMDVYRTELAEIVPVDFLRQFNEEQLNGAIRYCRALQIRIDRAYVSPAKDKTKARQLARHADKLKTFKIKEPSPACRELLQEYRSMLAEYKISLFAQEMKTAFPISATRLEKKWLEILHSC